MGLPETKGTLLKVKDGKMIDARAIDYAELFNMGKTDLEQQCIYLMKKRIALEDWIAILNKKNRGLTNAIKNRNREIEKFREKHETNLRITSMTLERINKEKNDLGYEIQRLQKENKELKEHVNFNRMVE